MLTENSFQKLFNEQGELLAVLVNPELWFELTAEKNLSCSMRNEIEEPFDDWSTFKDYWDFKYDFDASVHCENCGAKTNDWESDDPKQFKLTAASLGGLVGFKCISCGSRILKRHFKDAFNFECRPPCVND